MKKKLAAESREIPTWPMHWLKAWNATKEKDEYRNADGWIAVAAYSTNVTPFTWAVAGVGFHDQESRLKTGVE